MHSVKQGFGAGSGYNYKMTLAPENFRKELRFQGFLKTAPAPAECNDKLQLRIDLMSLNHKEKCLESISKHAFD